MEIGNLSHLGCPLIPVDGFVPRCNVKTRIGGTRVEKFALALFARARVAGVCRNVKQTGDLLCIFICAETSREKAVNIELI